LKYLQTGNFFGRINTSTHLENIILSDVVHSADRSDWHYHENAFFSFILKGRVLEENMKEQFRCSAGTLLFQHWQEPHYNICLQNHTKTFYVEIKKPWLEKHLLNNDQLQGSRHVDDPEVKLLFHNLYKESKISYSGTALGIQSTLIQRPQAIVVKQVRRNLTYL